MRFFGQSRFVPVVEISNVKHAVPLAQALIAGGVDVIEITLRTAEALDCIAAIAAARLPIHLGVGSLSTAEHFRQARQAGASFGVSPALTQTLADAARANDLPLIPGVATPSEALRASELGFEVLKFFPAEINGGLPWLKAVAGPLPNLRFAPTGGIDAGNAGQYLAQKNVLAVGGSWLAPVRLIEAGDWAAITRLCKAAQEIAAKP
jgi:2-dehydro-3-deoxyphosphogluconate aldolase / (4S)-4-hydroxy-2-oxoglutarate aldolase